ncbi:pyridoxal 5'-phosphate synthase glutaminase subunit PdxT [Sporohalobacter salinus]|uniref:pyridoxal 5'-phosphate synthase glutaminase subunit PdxT n=1 Tax=Sporohalobacter salinus TaxID=1494606 RepID=UPI0019618389|nr:pyridoxal 5'-phosphate synthase glutaminase subunit PdxT [Sporohalobacter salinus]MBM7623243.1 5'-phosphate synthase pdxT subunit [Sporohalobacter salinus]
MVRVGVLALQGGVEEHLTLLESFSEVVASPVKKRNELTKLDGLIIPGGESTTIGRLIEVFDLKETLIRLGREGLPIWGTCAGMIMLAKDIIGEEQNHLGLMNIEVKRNGYGNQLASFRTEVEVPKVAEESLPLVFIRAPYITEVGSEVEVLVRIDENIVAVEEENFLATSFHPELTTNSKFHQYFIDKVKAHIQRDEIKIGV